jgi:hypothetical protein
VRERERLELQEIRETVHNRQMGCCFRCGMPVYITQMQLAHRLAQTKANIKRFGRDVVHASVVGTHPTPDCNDGVLINPDSMAAARLAHELRKELRNGTKRS